MKSFGNLNPPPVDRSFSHLTEADVKSVFDSVLTVHQFQYQPNEDDTPEIRCANVSKELNQLGEYL